MITKVIKLYGDVDRKREPEETRIEFPAGYIYVVRTPSGDYWAHIGVFHHAHGDKYRHNTFAENLDDNGDPGPTGKITDSRVDCFDKHASETLQLADPLAQPNVDHIAVRISLAKKGGAE